MNIALVQLVSATLAAALFLLANLAFEKKVAARGRYLLGAILAISFLLPVRIPLFRVEIPESKLAQAGTEGEAFAGALFFPEASEKPGFTAGEGTQSEPQQKPAGQSTSKISQGIWAAVWAVYALGASITLFCTVYRYCRVVNSLRRCGRAPSERESEIFLKLCKKHGLRKSPALLVCPGYALGSSVAYGFFRSKIAIADKFREEDAALILEHELTHCKRKDAFFKAVLALLSSLYWFNPIMHLFIREMEEICEQSCDETLLKNGGIDEKKRYCRLLIETASSANAEEKHFASAFKGGKRLMKKRMENIIGKKSKILTVIVVVAVLLAVTVSSAIYLAPPPENIKVAYLNEPVKVCQALDPADIIEDYYNIDYGYSVDSDKVKITGTVMGKPFDINATFASPSYNGARMVYTAEDAKGNYFVQLVKFEFAQRMEAAELPIQDHDSGEYAWHKFDGWFKDYANENPQYKNVLEVYLTPIDENGNVTDEIIIIEIFIEEDFITNYIKTNNAKCVDEIAHFELEEWNIRWIKKYELWKHTNKK